jgi:hypothetical protein
MIMFLLFIFLTLSSFFEIPFILYVVGFIVIILVAVIVSRRRRLSTSPEFGLQRDFPFQSGRPTIGRWIVIPIVIIGVVAFILFENWWLDVNILTSMYLSKAGVDWWQLSFLNNYYFYVCIAIGLLIALSDPRIAIEKDPQGNRQIYFHSKFWGMINTILTQISEYGSNFIPVRIQGQANGDKLSLKRGLLWRFLEFLVGALVIGPLVAKQVAFGYLMIARWLETQQITWLEFLQRCFSVLSTRLLTPELLTGFELGDWLIVNSPALEFLLWMRIPLYIFIGVWGARLMISAVLEFLGRRIFKFFRNLIGIAFLVLIPFVLQMPSQAFDVTTPFYNRTILIAMVILGVLFVFLSLRSNWVELGISRMFRTRLILFSILIIISVSLLSGPVIVAVQYAPAMQGRWREYQWEPKYLPNVIYTRWATGLESIAEDDIDSAINTGTNLEILRQIRVFNEEAAKLRLKPSIGVNWMDFPREEMTVDIVSSADREYWVAPLTIVLPSGADPWRSSRLLITRSERILAIDAANGEIVPIASVFNLTAPYAMYYGEQGLFESSPMAYIGVPGFTETRLSDSQVPATYEGDSDYVLDGFERLWFFSGLYGRERLALDFGRGDFGPVNMLFLRDVEARLSRILLPGMTLDSDPYLVSDGTNIYYSLYVYIDRDMPTEYLDYPSNEDQYWRVFATVLVNAYDGSVQGYLLNADENNYVLNFYRGMYSQWEQPVPEWLVPQLRYPEFLFERQIDSYNLYHVSNPDFWQQSTDFFAETTNSAGNEMEDVRYVRFYLNGTTYWAATRLVEFRKSASKNLAGMYVALNGENFGEVFLLRTGNVAVIGPQTALDTINNYGPTKEQLTLHPNWQSGNILMYVINNEPYYFIPYYGQTQATLTPAMSVIVDAMSQEVGYYVILDPNNADEVGLASEKAYLNVLGTTVETTAEARKKKVIDEFQLRGYSLKTPQEINLDIHWEVAFIEYFTEDDWDATNTTISSFITSWVDPYAIDPIIMLEEFVSGVRYLKLGIPLSVNGVSSFYFIKIAYG